MAADEGKGTNAPDKKSWVDIIKSVDTWWRLLALIVLVAEAVLYFAMQNTPDTSPLKVLYPVFMFILLFTIIVGLFLDRYTTRETAKEIIFRALELLDPKDRRDALSSLIALFKMGAENAPQAEQPKLQEISRKLEAELISIPPEAQDARNQLKELARKYDAIRLSMEPGSRRTLELTALVTKAQSLAKPAGYGSMEVSELFAGGSEGERIISLAVIQALPNKDFYEMVLQSISESRSAFEQYHALRAMDGIMPLLTADQKQNLAAILKDQQSGGDKKYIKPDSDRWQLSMRMLNAIQRS